MEVLSTLVHNLPPELFNPIKEMVLTPVYPPTGVVDINSEYVHPMYFHINKDIREEFEQKYYADSQFRATNLHALSMWARSLSDTALTYIESVTINVIGPERWTVCDGATRELRRTQAIQHEVWRSDMEVKMVQELQRRLQGMRVEINPMVLRLNLRAPRQDLGELNPYAHIEAWEDLEDAVWSMLCFGHVDGVSPWGPWQLGQW